MSVPRKRYRVYCFDAARNILSSDFVEAADDAEAVAIAKASDFGSKCEIWDGNRLVAQLDAKRRLA